jgi:cadmium resistance protein CadD (predicted permease)
MLLGLPELLIILMISLLGIVPLAVGVWVLVTLFNVRKSQDEMRARLERLEQTLARR